MLSLIIIIIIIIIVVIIIIIVVVMIIIVIIIIIIIIVMIIIVIVIVIIIIIIIIILITLSIHFNTVISNSETVVHQRVSIAGRHVGRSQHVRKDIMAKDTRNIHHSRRHDSLIAQN